MIRIKTVATIVAHGCRCYKIVNRTHDNIIEFINSKTRKNVTYVAEQTQSQTSYHVFESYTSNQAFHSFKIFFYMIFFA